MLWDVAVDRDDFIIAVFCVVDEALPHALDGQRLRQRGPAPLLADSEVMTMEVVGEYLGLERDRALFTYFCRYDAHVFQALRTLHRTTFARQAANRWGLKERLGQQLLGHIPHDSRFAIIEASHCLSASSPRPSLSPLAGGAGIWQGYARPANLLWAARPCAARVAGRHYAVRPALTEQTQGTLIGDRNYWSSSTMAEWQSCGVEVLAPYRSAKRDPQPRWSAVLSRMRYRSDTVFGQLVDRCAVKRVWASGRWHL